MLLFVFFTGAAGAGYISRSRASTVTVVLVPHSCDLSFAELCVSEASCELPSAGLLISCCWHREVVASSNSSRQEGKQSVVTFIFFLFSYSILYSFIAVAKEFVVRFLHPEGVVVSRFSGVSSTDGLIGFVHLTDTPRSRTIISEPRYIIVFEV